MKGTNPVAHLAHDKDGLTLSVQEIFRTIQGEGPFAGMPSVFLRLAGCGLKCGWCDSFFEDDKDMSADAIAKTVKQFIAAWKNPLVVITGGEPLRQNIIYLCDVLLQLGCHVQIETAGYCWPPNMSKELGIYFHSKHLTVVCSPKTPGLHNEVKRWCRDWKYIVSAKDGICGMRPGMDVTNNFDLLGTIWLQPRDDGDEIENKRNVAEAVKLCDRYGYRLSLQTHKIIGVP